MRARRATLRVIAERAGCSRMTVSLALRHDPQVSARTRERIQKIAREIGYQPDATLRALMAHVRARQPAKFCAAIAALHIVSHSVASKTHCYAEWMAGAAERAAQLGYIIDDLWLADAYITPAHLERILMTRAIRGLLLPCLANAFELPSGFHFLLDRYPCATAGDPTASLPALSGATNDRFATGAALVERARAAGCRRIGVVVADTEPLADERFSAGIAKSRGRHPDLASLPELACDAGSQAAFRAWFREHRPDGVITTVPEVWTWLREEGVSVPEEVAFLFWQLHAQEPSHRDWSGTSQNERQIGAAAVELIVEQLHRGERGVPSVRIRKLIESSFVSGTTLRG